MHLFAKHLKMVLKNRVIIFWILLFPMALSTFLKIALANIDNSTSFNPINIAIVDKENYPEGFMEMLSSLKFDNEKDMFNIKETNLDEAKSLLDEGEIIGYIEENNDSFVLTIKVARFGETIIKSVLDQYLQTTSAITHIMIASGGTADPIELATQLSNQKNYLAEYETGVNSPNSLAIYFYSIIGMSVMYGGYLGTLEITTVQANLSPTGARVSVGPIKRYKMLLIKMGAANLVHYIAMLFLVAYLNLVLKITIANNIGLVLLLITLGSITGVWFGAFTAISLKKASIGLKIAITSIVGLFGGMLSGMMTPVIKFWVMTKAPILAYINPVNLINDGLYSLYYYPTYERYFSNLFLLIGFMLFFIIGTMLFFRRDNYESI